MDEHRDASPSVLGTVRDYITGHFLEGRAGLRPGDDDSFLERGIIDSTGVLELVGFLQDRFGIRIEDEELVPDNLDSIAKAAAFVEAKTAETASAGAGLPALNRGGGS